MPSQVVELLLIGLLAGALIGSLFGIWIGSVITRSHFKVLAPAQTTNQLNGYARPRRVVRYGDEPGHYE